MKCNLIFFFFIFIVTNLTLGYKYHANHKIYQILQSYYCAFLKLWVKVQILFHDGNQRFVYVVVVCWMLCWASPYSFINKN